MPTFEDFERLARARGGTARDCGRGHWQVRGKQIVNYYPFGSRGPIIYVQGTSRSVILGSPEAAVNLAYSPPPRGKLEPRLSREQARVERTRLLQRRAHCHWCRKPLTPATATLDHRVPLGRGGTNRRDNLVLACGGCNRDRGSDMPELRDGISP